MIGHVLLSMNEVVTDNYSAQHQAVDIVGAGHSISDVIAYDDGVVEMVVSNIKYTNHKTKGTDTYGNFVKLRHPDGSKTLYAHLKHGSVTVYRGQSVYKGQKIGTMGATGNAYGTHLHFEVRNANEKRENPRIYLEKKPAVQKEVLAEPTLEKSKEGDVQITEKVEEKPGQKPIIKEEAKPEVPETKKAEKPAITTKRRENIEVVKKDISPSKIETNLMYLENNSYDGGSIVDGLKTIGMDSSFDYRTILANKNGITNYRGSYSQNVKLLKLLKQGNLIKA